MQQKSRDEFMQEFLNSLCKSQRKPGCFITVEKNRMSQPSTIQDMRAYIDSSFINVLAQRKYQYVIDSSTIDSICLLDCTHEFREYVNAIDEISFSYDPDKKKVVEFVINSVIK